MKYTNFKKILVLCLASIAVVFRVIVFQKGFNSIISPVFNIYEITLWQSFYFLMFIAYAFKYKTTTFNKTAEPINFKELKEKAIISISHSIIFLLFLIVFKIIRLC